MLRDHVIHSLRRKPGALLNLAYRAQVFPRDAYRRTFERLLAQVPERVACRTMVDLLALAHERDCEAELADILATHLDDNRLPDAHCLARNAPGSQPVASFNLLPTGVHRWGPRWGGSAWRHETSW